MDKESFERAIARRLVDHIEDKTTDMADSVLELPTEIYSQERLDQELDALFYGQPIVLALSGSLPTNGTFQTIEVCDTPVLMTRDNDGKVHVYLNSCRHRGVKVTEGCGAAKRFTCPFHGWQYGLDGKLGNVPVPEAFDGIDRETMGLIELPSAEGYGVIIGRLRPGAPVDIDEYLGPDVAGELAILDCADWPRFSETHEHVSRGNWKVAMDTFRENYHFNYLHGKTLAGYGYGGVLTFDAFGRHLRNATAVRTIDAIRNKPEEEWGDVSAHISPQYALFPNTNLTFDARHVELWQIFPDGADKSKILHTTYVRPDLSEDEKQKYAEMAPWICKDVVDAEDFWVSGQSEPGFRTGVLPKVLFGRNEPALQHLHRGYAEVIDQARQSES